MTDGCRRLRAVALVCLLVLSMVAVGPASAGGQDHVDDGDSETDTGGEKEGGADDDGEGDETNDGGTGEGDTETDGGTDESDETEKGDDGAEDGDESTGGDDGSEEGDDGSEDGDTDGDDGSEEGDDEDDTDDGDESNAGDGGDDGGQDDTPEPTTYRLEQGDRCIELSALEGDESVERFYDWEPEPSHYWSSLGTTDLQRTDTSMLFLYEDDDGTVSLVTVHEKVGDDASDGGAATFEFRGMPTGGTWTVQDDSYDGERNFDAWDVDGTAQQVDWTWTGGRTDGGAYEGIGNDFDLTIRPRFNERAALYGQAYEGEVAAWELLSGDQSDPERYSLTMDEPARIATGPCESAGSGSSSSPEFQVTDVAINRSAAAVGEPVGVDVNVTNEGSAAGHYTALLKADVDLIESADTYLETGETEQFSFTTTFDEIGIYDFKLRMKYLGTVDVHHRPDPAANASLTENGTVVTNVTYPDAGSTVSAELPERNESTLSVERLNVTTANGTNRMRVELDYLDAPGTNESPADGFDPVEYLELTNDAPDVMDDATVEFTVDRDALANADAPAAVTLLRYNGTADEWERLSATRRGETDDAYRYGAAVEEFSTFAVAQALPDVEVDGAVETTSATVSDSVGVTATVSNDGLATATAEVPLVVGDERAAVETVELEPGAQTDVTFEYTPTEVGDHAVSVAGERVASLSVSEPSTPAPSTEPDEATATDDTPTTDDEGSEEDGFDPALGLVALVVASVALGVARTN